MSPAPYLGAGLPRLKARSQCPAHTVKDLEPEWCMHCLGKTDIEEPERIARFVAICSKCCNDILPGQRIMFRYRQWVHVGCR